MELTREMLAALAEPFPPEAIQWKPGATNRDKSRCLALAYVDLRHYIDRLNDVAGVDWSDDYELQDGGKVVLCRLTICGVMRSDVGEEKGSNENTATTALAQAFKRACVKFGLGAHLYRMESRWVPYDERRKRIADEGLRQLGASVSSERPRAQHAAPVQAPAGNGNGNGSNGGGKVGPTEFWNEANKLAIDRTVALEVARGSGTWAEKLAALSR